MHRVKDALEALQRADRSEHMRGVRALRATGFDQATRLARAEEGIEETWRSILLEQALAEIVEQRKVEPRIRQLKAEDIFPIQTPTHRISGLPIR
jgi:hypothetical protein